MTLNLTREEVLVLNEVVLQEKGRFIYLGRHTPLAGLRRKLKKLARKANHGT